MESWEWAAGSEELEARTREQETGGKDRGGRICNTDFRMRDVDIVRWFPEKISGKSVAYFFK